MKRRAAAAACLWLGLCHAVEADTPAGRTAGKGGAVPSRASGTFDVTVKPLPKEDRGDGWTADRLSLDKQFKGDLEGTGRGVMMTAETGVEGSGGYVAIERVTGTLKERSGSFIVLHKGTMRRGGEYTMAVTVVPDSGTGQLAGL